MIDEIVWAKIIAPTMRGDLPARDRYRRRLLVDPKLRARLRDDEIRARDVARAEAPAFAWG